jgi:cold-inducible RNA-binding protein
MDTKLYVGNLSYSTTEEDLRILFAQYGGVATIELIKDRQTGNSKGFAFVEMTSQSESNKAISSLNGSSLDDREIKVSVAKPREERPKGNWYSDSGSNSYGNKKPNVHKKRGGSRSY